MMVYVGYYINTNKPISMLSYPIVQRTNQVQDSAHGLCLAFYTCCLYIGYWKTQVGTGKYCGKSYPKGAHSKSLKNINEQENMQITEIIMILESSDIKEMVSTMFTKYDKVLRTFF